MIYIIILGIIILGFVISDNVNENPKKQRKLVAYNSQTGKPIYLDECRLVGYDENNGNPIFENPYQIVKYNSQTGAPIYANFEISKEEYKEYQPVYKYNQPTNNVKKPMTDEDRNRISNSILMIVGALLVVVASIIFLASSWETIPGIIKTLVLVLIQGIFILFGYLCNNKLKIKKVAKVFNYLSLAFVPIILLSLSTFEVIGDYLSINGDGSLLYFAIAFLISDVLYKVVGSYKKDKVSKIMSFVAEVLAIISLFTYLDLRVELVLIVLSIYNILIYILMHGNYLDSNAYKLPNNIFNYLLLIFIVIIKSVISSLLIYVPVILYTLYFYSQYASSKNTSDRVYSLVLFIISYVIDLTIINRINISPYFVYILSIIPLVLLTKEMKNEKTKNILYNIESIAVILFIVEALGFPNKTLYYLMTFISGLIYYLMMFIITKKPIYKVASYIMFTAIFVDIFYIVDILDYAKYIPLVVGILIYLFELIFEQFKDEFSRVLLILILVLESFLLVGTYFVLVPLVLMIGYLKAEKIDEALLIIPMLTSLSLFNINNNLITVILSYVLISIYTIMSLLHKKVNIYSIASLLAIIMAGMVFNYKNYIFFSILLVWSIVHFIINAKDNNYLYKTVGIIGSLGLYISCLKYFDIEFISLQLIGYYVAVMAMTVFVLKAIKGEFDIFMGCFGFAIISLVGFFIIDTVTDAVIIMGFLFLVSLISFIKKWRHYLYESLIIMIINILYLTIEFWAQIPWYFYILVIGMGLIIFAMFDEKIKQKKENKALNRETNNVPLGVENTEVNNIVSNMSEVNEQPKEETEIPKVSEIKEEMELPKEESVNEEVELPKEVMAKEENNKVSEEIEVKEDNKEKQKEEVVMPKKRGRKKKVENKE